MDDSQSHAGAFVLFFGGEIRIKYAIQGLGIHTMARIADAELYIRTWIEFRILSGLFEVQVHIVQFDTQNTALTPHGMG